VLSTLQRFNDLSVLPHPVQSRCKTLQQHTSQQMQSRTLYFVPKRLIVTETQHKSDVSYRAILKKKSAPTLAFLYDVFTNTKDEHSNATVKVDRNVLQRLLIIYHTG